MRDEEEVREKPIGRKKIRQISARRIKSHVMQRLRARRACIERAYITTR